MSDIDVPGLVYLAILLLMVSGGLFAAYRQRLGQGLQHAAIWVLIFLGAVVAYGFRDVLDAELTGAVRATAEDRGVVLSRRADGHFHAPIEVNGRRIDFLVDTGASDIVLSAQDAARVGLDPERLIYSRRAATANGVVAIAPVTLDVVRLGPFEDRNVSASVNSGAQPGSLLGLSYLDRFARWRVEGDRMVLER